MIKLIDTSVEVPLIWEGDDAIDAEGTDLLKYAREPAEVATHVSVKPGETPTRWVCRPLDSQTYQRALQQSQIGLTKDADNLLKNASQSLHSLPLSLVRIENLKAEGDCYEGSKLKKVLRSVSWEIKRDIGSLVVKMSMGARGASPINTLAARWVDVSVAGDELVDELEGVELPGDAALALEKLREVLRPSLAAVDPVNEGEGQDLGK